MADGGPVLLDGDDFDRLRTVVRRAESYPQNMRRLPRAAGVAGGPGLFTLRVTNGTPDGSGYYQATITVWDTVAAAYSDYDTGFLLPMNGETLVNAKRYAARAVGPYSTGQAYQVSQGYATPAYSLTVATTDAGFGDSNLSISGVSTIEVDQASGLQLVNDGGKAEIQAQAATVAHNGVVTTSAQAWQGRKTLWNSDGNAQLQLESTTGKVQVDYLPSSGTGHYGKVVVWGGVALPEFDWVFDTGVYGGLPSMILSISSPSTALLTIYGPAGGAPSPAFQIGWGLTTYTGATGTSGGGDDVHGGLITSLGSGASVITVGTTNIAGGVSNGLLFETSGGLLGQLAAGTTGQILAGNTGAAPAFASLTSLLDALGGITQTF
jgi:hypothetical protein